MELIYVIMLDIPKEMSGIRLCKKSCNNIMCNHRCSDIVCNGKYYCFNPDNAIFVRHAKLDKDGRAYGYGDWYCAVKVALFDNPDMFASSEKEYIKTLL